MNWLGVISIIMGISYLIYAIIARKKVTIYFGGTNGVKIIDGNEEKYFKLQLYFSVLNSLIYVSAGIAIVLYDFSGVYMLVIPIIVNLINWISKLIGRLNGYIEV